MMKALVIDALARADGKRYATFDVVGAGPRLVTGYLNQLGVRTDLKTYEYVVENPSIIDDYDSILISAMLMDKGALARLVSLVKGDQTIIVGGPISLDFYNILRENTRIDLVVIGEAENQLKELFENHYRHLLQRDYSSLYKVKGIAYRINEKIVFTGFADYTSKSLLNTIKPYTRIDKSYEDPWYRRFYVEVLRGCSNFYRPLIRVDATRTCIKCMKCRSEKYVERLVCPKGIYPGCGFCNVPFLFGPPRTRSVGPIVSEIRELIRYGARRVVLSAPDFLDYGREYLVEKEVLTDPCSPPPNTSAIKYLLEKIYEIPEVSSGEVRVFVENLKACLVNEEIAKTLGSYLKGTTVHIGLETCSDNYNRDVVGKPITRAHVFKAVELLRKAGLRPYIYMIYGLPYMDKKVYEETIKCIPRLYDLGVEKITLYKFIPLPFTSFENYKPEISKYRGQIMRLKSIVKKYNRKKKQELIGSIIEAYVVKSRRGFYGYPVLHGPVIIINKITDSTIRRILLRSRVCIASIKMTRAGERVVYGNIVAIKKCFTL